MDLHVFFFLELLEDLLLLQILRCVRFSTARLVRRWVQATVFQLIRRSSGANWLQL